MKRNLLLLIVLCCTMSMLAQNGKISYQAVVRDSENHLVYDTPLQVTVALANSETGTAVYSEQHAVTSNANGLISLLIGDGQNKQGHWEDVQWNTAWVTATIRKASDQTFLAEHHLPLSAVPYALYADFADSVNLAVLQDYLDEHHYVTEDELPAVQANADWTETNPDTASYIKNKPDLNDYEKKSELCGDVKECIKDTLKYYTTSDQIDTLLGAYYDTTHTKSVISDTATALRAMMGDAAYNAKITLKKNNVELDSFRLNQQTDKAINIPVPTTVAELSDAGNYVTKEKLNDTLGKYTTSKKIDTLLDAYAKTEDLAYYELKEDLCGDVKDCIKDTLGKYTTSNQIDTLLSAYYDTTHTKSVISDTATALRNMMVDAANDGQLTIIAAGDTMRFTANQATNDTVRLNKFATKDTLAYYAMTSALKDSLTHYVGKDMLNDTLSKYTTSKKIDTLLGAYAKTEDLAYYERQDNLCRDVKICIKDTLGKYTTSNQIDTLLKNYVKGSNLCDSIVKCDVIKDMRDSIRDNAAAIQTNATNIQTNATNIGLNKQAIIDSSAHIRNEIKYGQITIALNRGSETGVTNPTFGVNQADTQIVTINIPEATTVNNGQLTIIAAGDTTRFTANQATNDTMRLDKFATKEALKDTAKTLRGIICDSATACITKALADPTSEINYAIDTIARHNIHDTAVAIRNSIGNGTLTIQKNGSTVGTFTANQVADQTVDIAVPTKLSQLANDGGVYAKRDSVNVFTNVNNFTSTVTVPSNTITIPRPTTAAHPCTDNTANAVNVCDLLAVFDSLTNKMNNILKTIDTLKHVNDSLAQEIASLKPILTVTGPSENQHLCGGSNTITFTASITNANAGDYTYSWTVNGTAQSSTDTVLYYTPAATGGYKVICTATRSGFTPLKDSASVNVSEGGFMPKFGICVEGHTVTVKSTENSLTTTVVWGDGTESVVTAGDSHEYANGNYTIIASSTAFGNCKLSWPITITETTSSPCSVTIPHTNTSIYTNTTGGLETVVDGKVVSVRDQEGNTYYVTQIGNQCWMRTNLRTSKYNDGATIPGGANCSSYSTTDPYHYINTSYDPSYGYFYNWPAASHKNSYNRLNLCPKGWHVPSQEEWATLFSEAGVTTPKNTGTGAVYLAGGCGWEEITPGTSSATPNSYENQDRDKWGFTALPTGRCWLNNTTDLTFEEYGRGVYFWSSTEADADDAYDWYLGAGYPGAENEGLEKLHGRSVRCLRDSDGGDAPYLSLIATPDDESVLICSSYPPSTSEVHTVTYTATIENDNVENYTFEWIAGGDVEEEAGTTLTRSWGEGTHMVVCVATKGNVVLKDTVTISVTVGNVPDIDEININALMVRLDLPAGINDVDSVAWGDNSGEKVSTNVGNVHHTYQSGGEYTITAYSSLGCTFDTTVTVVDCASAFVCGVCKVNDADEHSYSTVTIAGQCWMAENLRSTSYSSNITNAPTLSNNKSVFESGAYYGYPNGISTTVANYGLLYNWYAAMGGSTTEGAQGICPDGWHIPTQSDIQALLGNQNYNSIPDGFNIQTAGSLTRDGDNVDPDANVGTQAFYWSSATNGSDNIYNLQYEAAYEIAHADYSNKNTKAYSVRCVKNAGGSTAQTDPSVSTSEATINSNTATLKGTVNNPDNVEISNKGFGWKLSTASDYTDVTEGISFSNSMMTFDLENLAAGTYSYYAFISFGSTTVYGDTLPFTIEGADPSPCTTIPTFTTCENGLTVNITSVDNATSINWGDGSELDDNPSTFSTHTYGNNGVYTITATSTPGCTATKQVAMGIATLHPCTGLTAHQTGYTGNGYNGENDGYEEANSEGIISVSDYDGNVYPVVQIGGQCWLAENMRCTHSPRGVGNHYIVNPENLSGDHATVSTYSKAAHWYLNDSTTYSKFGLLYNWCAALDTFYSEGGKNEIATESQHFELDPWNQLDGPSYYGWNAGFGENVIRRGICPKGWHVPNLNEFISLMEEVTDSTINFNINKTNYEGPKSGKLSKGCDWYIYDEYEDNSPSDFSYNDRNSTGFGGLPAGYFNWYNDENDGLNSTFYDSYLEFAYFWSSTEQQGSVNNGKPFLLSFNTDYATFKVHSSRDKDHGSSVRCVRDAE